MDAIHKSFLMPAQRLEAMSPQMRQKGRIKSGVDADLLIFDSQHNQPELPAGSQ
jgi:N-acetylglucosamine-6-phosphate deacetylase